MLRRHSHFPIPASTLMDKLNDYLQRLLSSCSEELRLEPDRNPYLVSHGGTTDVANVPLLGTQIGTMIFPLIPPDAKSALPNKAEIEFVHPNNLGNFNFTVQKSPAGFVVTIRPMLSDPATYKPPVKPLPEAPPVIENYSATEPMQTNYSAPAAAEPYEIETNSGVYDLQADPSLNNATLNDLLFEDKSPAQEYVPSGGEPPLELISSNDPSYQTVFSRNAEYEPPGRRDDFSPGEYKSPAIEHPLESKGVPVVLPPAAPSAHAADPVEVRAAPNPLEAARMDALFTKMAELGASDLHLSVSMPPLVRADGKIKPLESGQQPLTEEAMRSLLTSIMPAKNQDEFASRHDTDFAYDIPGLARFRCNIFMDRRGMGGVFRIIPAKMTTAEQLGLSQAILGLCELSKGLVVVTGPTGSGKSTTLCAMVNHINMRREDHIITIEDPIEFVHENQKCLVNQREVHNHTDSFKDALRAALREDPDILLVGEMRDLETISIAIETAETGHLVFGTLHTTTAASTVDRIIDQFPADRQQQIRVMLSESLKGVIAQTLLPKKGGGRVAALEVLIVTPAISNLIREGKTFQIPSAMQTGKNHGMVMLNEALFAHVQNGTVEPRDAYLKAVDKTGFETMLTRGGFKL